MYKIYNPLHLSDLKKSIFFVTNFEKNYHDLGNIVRESPISRGITALGLGGECVVDTGAVVFV